MVYVSFPLLLVTRAQAEQMVWWAWGWEPLVLVCLLAAHYRAAAGRIPMHQLDCRVLATVNPFWAAQFLKVCRSSCLRTHRSLLLRMVAQPEDVPGATLSHLRQLTRATLLVA